MRRCPACGGENPPPAKFCLECGASLAEALSLDERKVVSVLFCDLVGFTAASETADPEDVMARTRPYHARVREDIEGFGGTVEKFVGDAVMAVFGAPIAHEDDAERAVRAALRITESIDELNESDASLALAVRVAVNTGEAVVARSARPDLGEGIVTGDVVNTAWRRSTGSWSGTRRTVRRDRSSTTPCWNRCASRESPSCFHSGWPELSAPEPAATSPLGTRRRSSAVKWS